MTTAIENLTAEEVEMLEDTDVLSHIQQQNAEYKKQAEEEGYTCYFLVSERIASDFRNVYHYEFEMALQSYSDCYKEKVGIRPALKRDEWTLSDVEEKLRKL